MLTYAGREVEAPTCSPETYDSSLLLLLPAYVTAYVSIRQHTSAYVSIVEAPTCSPETYDSSLLLLLPAYVSIRQHTSAYVSIRQHTSAYVRTPPYSHSCLNMSAYVSIRQHTSAYVSITTHAATTRATALAVSLVQKYLLY
jgi:pantothenate kinase